MSIFIANADAASVLARATAVSAIRDRQGKLLGLFSPGTGEDAQLYLDAWLTLDPTALRRQKNQSEPTYSYAEVKARIGMGDVS